MADKVHPPIELGGGPLRQGENILLPALIALILTYL